MPRLRKLLVGAVAAGAALMLAGPALAQPIQTPIGKKQYFAGQVNGNMGSSVLSVVGCPSPVSAVAATGNGTILPGQTVSAFHFLVPPPVPVGSDFLGYTGAAHKVSVDLEVAFIQDPLIYEVHIADLTAYNTTVSLPLGLTVPCSNATFTMVFTPVNGGAKAMDSDVKLTLGTPRIVPVGTTVVQPPRGYTLNGSGWAPNTSYTVEECSETSWIVPQDPCIHSNSVMVTTSTAGAFSHAFVPAPCSPALISSCYVGVPMPSGIDTINLVGAAPIMVG
jgi:hypothetical protein